MPPLLGVVLTARLLTECGLRDMIHFINNI